MALTFEQSREQVARLAQLFSTNREAYRRAEYKEAHARQELIDPLFEALGWDVHNNQRAAPDYREVVFEDTVEIEGQKKAPDYVFRVGRERKFFAEAKKPGVDLKNAAAPAYQLRRYAWTAKLPLSVLTDFEEFATYDCRSRPAASDRPSVGRVSYFTYGEYAERWRELWEVYSREAVYGGSFDQFAQASKGKRGTSEVDTEFLKEIEGWREALARNLALRNPNLGIDELNDAVQRTIDRIIFLRLTEDRGIEEYGRLQRLTQGEDIYKGLVRLFRNADAKYNSGLFDFSREGDRLTAGLSLDDKTLRPILADLYFPQSPYEFSVLPPEILGNVYEQFLGKVIRLTAGHQAKVEEKPEVKKAGGVYYTPAYIVRYIVENTVGQQVAGKSPAQLRGLRVLDPACGSGSFLLGAYQYLLDYYLGWYTANAPEKHTREVRQLGEAWRLTIAEKKRILTEHIFGVDIDRQAVEVTKLSLLLAVLESGGGEQTQQLTLLPEQAKERVLPNLDRNIKCGNSLIGPDYFGGQLLPDADELRRVNPFDWKAEFPEAMKAGGFDCVIGNPPYVRPHNIEPAAKQYFWKHYGSFVKKSDLYCCFMEKELGLLKSGGELGLIVSNGWLRLDSFQELRKLLLDQSNIERIIEFSDYVFDNATVKTLIMTLSRVTSLDGQVLVATAVSDKPLSQLRFNRISQRTFANTYKQMFDLSIREETEILKNAMVSRNDRLGDHYEISFGLKTGDDSLFLTHSKTSKEHKPLLRGADIHRYEFQFAGEYVWYVPEKMRQHRQTARPGTSDRFEQPKVLIRDTGGGLEGTYDDESFYVKDVLVISLTPIHEGRLKFLCAILNSRMMRYFYETSFPTLHVQRDELASLPIKQFDQSDINSQSSQNQVVRLVEQMLDLHKRLVVSQDASEKQRLQRVIDATDQQIDALVYELYGLTAEEVAVVEGSKQ